MSGRAAHLGHARPGAFGLAAERRLRPQQLAQLDRLHVVDTHVVVQLDAHDVLPRGLRPARNRQRAAQGARRRLAVGRGAELATQIGRVERHVQVVLEVQQKNHRVHRRASPLLVSPHASDDARGRRFGHGTHDLTQAQRRLRTRARLSWISLRMPRIDSLSTFERTAMLKLITWNIQSARTPAGNADLDAIVARVRGIADFDLLCLQEVSCGFAARDGSPGGDQFAGLARRLPHYHAVSAPALDTPDAEGAPRRLGSMLFTRHPVLQVLRHSLPWPADPAVPSMPRCALEVTLSTPLGPLRVVNAHLEYFSERQRLAQVERLRALHLEACAHARAARADGPGPFAAIVRPAAAILVGDFNMLPESSAYARLLSDDDDDKGNEDAVPAWRDAWRLAHPGRRHAPTVGLHDRTPGAAAFTFDYAFVSADLAGRVRKVHVDGGVGGSDHQPLLLELA
jgi:endonuclease/exonuclease/phosphatase family metal-dependent hydrolase